MLRLRLACVKHLILALFAVALLLGAVEVGLRVRHSLQVQSAEKSQNLASLVLPSWKYHHALKPLKAAVRRNPDTSLPVTIRTNSFGLRGPEVMLPKPADVYRIVYLGDDAVFASELPEEECFCDLIEQSLSDAKATKYQIVNAGIPGYCPLLSYLQFKHSLAGLEPDLLILNIDMSDVADDHRYRRHARLGEDERPLICSHPMFQPPLSPSRPMPAQQLMLFQLLKRQLGGLPADDNRLTDRDEIDSAQGCYAWTLEDRTDWQVYISQAISPIGQLKELANRLPCPLVVSVCPAPWQISGRAMPDPAARKKWGIAANRVYDPGLATRFIRRELRLRSVPFCDVTPAFREAPEPETLFLETVPRLSRRGHRVFAETVINFLQKIRNPNLEIRNKSEGPKSSNSKLTSW